MNDLPLLVDVATPLKQMEGGKSISQEIAGCRIELAVVFQRACV
jgi:hypothetical protein